MHFINFLLESNHRRQTESQPLQANDIQSLLHLPHRIIPISGTIIDDLRHKQLDLLIMPQSLYIIT